MTPLTNFLLHKLSKVLHYISKISVSIKWSKESNVFYSSVFPYFLTFINIEFDFRVCVSGLFSGEAA